MHRTRVQLLLSYALVGAGVMVSAGAGAQGVPVEAASRTQKSEAIEPYRSALEAYDAGRYDEALTLFQKSYDLVASPNSRMMLARTLVKLNRLPEAYAEFQGVISDAQTLAKGESKYAQTAESARQDLKELSAKLTLVTLDVDGALTVNGERLSHGAPGPIAMLPGKTTFRLALENGAQIERTVELKAGEEQTVSLRLPAAEAAPSNAASAPTTADDGRYVSRETLGYVSAGVGGAGLLTFTIFGLLATGQANALQDECVGIRCPQSSASTAETGRSFQTVANIGLGFGIVGAGAAAYFLWPSLVGEGSGTQVSVGPGSVTVRGRF